MMVEVIFDIAQPSDGDALTGIFDVTMPEPIGGWHLRRPCGARRGLVNRFGAYRHIHGWGERSPPLLADLRTN